MPLSRRELLVASGAGAAALATGPTAAWARRLPDARSGTFPHGVLAGMPGERSILLQTKLGGVERDVALVLEVARDPDFRRVVHRKRVRASGYRDGMARARVTPRRPGLAPGEEYWYRFSTKTGGSPVGRFVTARPQDSREPIRIGFFSCQSYNFGYYTAHAGLAAEPDLDLVVCLGDYIYETDELTPGGAGQETGAEIRTDDTGGANDEVETLSEYRAKYDLYRSDPNLRAMHAAHPFVAIWDDHEVENNNAGRQGAVDDKRRAIPYEARRRNGYMAWFEAMPVLRLRAERDRIYRRLPLGANAELFLLDERQYRSREPGGTLLGAEQKAWLKRSLANSRSAWKVLGNQLMLMSLDFPAPGIPFNEDAWDGYPEERLELLSFLIDREIKDVVAVTGDIHTFFAGTVTDTGRRSRTRPGRPVATEFVGGSITTSSIFDLGGQEESGPTGPVSSQVVQFNPHMSFASFTDHGYGVLEARPDELRVRFRAARSIKEQRSDVFTLAEFRVERGSPEVQRVA